MLKDLQGGQLFTYYIQAVSSYFSPPIAAVYILLSYGREAVQWKGKIGFTEEKEVFHSDFFINSE